MTATLSGDLRRSLAELQARLPRPVHHYLVILRRRRHWADAGVIFVHIPKTAGTSISVALYGRPLGHLPASDIQRADARQFARLPVFSVTRNPWDRLVSAYRFVIQAGTAHAGLKPSRDYESPAFRSFNSFVEDWLVGRQLDRLDHIFAPQYPFVYDKSGRLLVDFVGRVEAMSDVESYLAGITGRPIAIGRLNTTASGVDYRSYYGDRTLINRVGDLYTTDIELFGYDF